MIYREIDTLRNYIVYGENGEDIYAYNISEKNIKQWIEFLLMLIMNLTILIV